MSSSLLTISPVPLQDSSFKAALPTRKQAYREYTTELLRMAMGGHRVGTQNEGAARSKGVSSGTREWDSAERQGLEGDKTRPILYYSTIVVYQSHTDRYSVFAIRGNHACRALLAQHQK